MSDTGRFSATPETYADQIGGIYFSGTTVKIELVSFPPGANADDRKRAPVVREVIVMPAEGFLRSFAALESMMGKLQKAGVVRKGDAAASPNFEKA